ncbi:MAG: alpha/beta fold hydrolase [bacterium]|nr:alpha/beta fold hydrolase [bacterium]MDE0288161.1 alpha/beta fold hydrolase [bacterium]MDE0437098.1 alpha/beta fold hydrolase [bacterium]
MTVPRRFVEVGGRQVQYRTAGDGPPVIVLHDVPGSSTQVAGIIEELAGTRRVYAPDAPGHGLSDAIPGRDEMSGFVESTVAFIDALGLGRVPLVGPGVGGLLALAAARTDPHRFPVVVDRTVRMSADRRERLEVEGYPAFSPRLDGAHLASVWHWVRSRFMYRAPDGRTADDRLRMDLPSPGWLSDLAVEILRRGPEYAGLARAALAPDPGPTLRILSEEGSVQVVEFGPPEAPGGMLAEAVAASSDLPPAPPRPRQPEARPGVISRRFVDTPQGQLHLRQSGIGGLPLLLIHQSPGSAESLEPMISHLAPDRLVLAPDTLGNGHSDKPPVDRAGIGYYAGVLSAALDGLGIDKVDVWGSHTGALIAMELAVRYPERVQALGMDGITLFDPAFVEEALANYFPPLKPDMHGLHLLRAWLIRLDMYLFWPWYNHTAAGANVRPLPDVGALKQWADDLLASGRSWRVAYRAAFEYPTRDRLPLLTRPTLLATSPVDPLRFYSEEAAGICDAITVAESEGYVTPEAARNTAELYRAFFARTDR